MVPKGWQKSQVSDICKLQNGNGFKPHQWDTKGLPIIRIQNLNGSDNFNYYSGEVNDKWLVETGQLLFSWAGTKGVSFGPFVWKRERGVLNQHIYKVFAHENVSYDWLYEALKWVTHKIEAQAHGFKSTLVHVKKQDIDNQSILVPPFSEQQRIAKILSTWDNAISTTEKLIANSKQQKKALMQQLLTGKKRLVNPETGKAFEGEWEDIKLGNACSKVTDGAHHSPKSVGHGYPMFSVKDMKSTGFSENTARHISKEDFAALVKQNCKPEINDILIAKDGSILKYCFVVKEDIQGVILSSIALLRPKLNKIHPDFVAQYFSQEAVRFFVGKALTSGSGVPRIILKDFKSIHLRIPCLLEQHNIASVLTAADKEIELLEVKLAHFKLEKKALMQQLLTGKRRVKIAA